MRAPQPDLPPVAADLWARLRARRPRVHCITNTVAQAFTANVLLAAGAVPSMTVAPDEVGAFVKSGDALLVNLGTFDANRRKACDLAVTAALDQDRPWVLDPVLVDRSPARAAWAAALAARQPAAVRLNRAEFKAIAGFAPEGGALIGYALERQTVIALTGPIDFVADAERLASVENGHALMSRVTAMGCAGSALLAAFLAIEREPWLASVAALLAFGIAGEVAGAAAKGPGSFAVAMLDALHALEPATIARRAKVQ
jgi:hydroxyethylthiazole kinase